CGPRPTGRRSRPVSRCRRSRSPPYAPTDHRLGALHMRRAPDRANGRGARAARMVCSGPAAFVSPGATPASAEVVGDREVGQPHRGTGAVAEAGVRAVEAVVVGRHRVCGGTGLLGRLDLDVTVTVDAGTGRDELTDDDVLLQAH